MSQKDRKEGKRLMADLARNPSPVLPVPPARMGEPSQSAPAPDRAPHTSAPEAHTPGGGGGAAAQAGGGMDNSSHPGDILTKRAPSGDGLTTPLCIPEPAERQPSEFPMKKNSDGAPPPSCEPAAAATVAQVADALGLPRPRMERLAHAVGVAGDAAAPLDSASVASVASAVGVEPEALARLLAERAPRAGVVASFPRNPSLMAVRLIGEPGETVTVRVAARLRERWRLGMAVTVRPVSAGIWEVCGPVPRELPRA